MKLSNLFERWDEVDLPTQKTLIDLLSKYPVVRFEGLCTYFISDLPKTITDSQLDQLVQISLTPSQADEMRMMSIDRKAVVVLSSQKTRLWISDLMAHEIRPEKKLLKWTVAVKHALEYLAPRDDDELQ